MVALGCWILVCTVFDPLAILFCLFRLQDQEGKNRNDETETDIAVRQCHWFIVSLIATIAGSIVFVFLDFHWPTVVRFHYLAYVLFSFDYISIFRKVFQQQLDKFIDVTVAFLTAWTLSSTAPFLSLLLYAIALHLVRNNS